MPQTTIVTKRNLMKEPWTISDPNKLYAESRGKVRGSEPYRPISIQPINLSMGYGKAALKLAEYLVKLHNKEIKRG